MNAKETYLRSTVLHTCGHEVIYTQGYKQSEYSFNEGIEKRSNESCFDCRTQEEAFWNLVKHALKNLHLKINMNTT